MNWRIGVPWAALALLPACSAWQRGQVSEAVVERLECPREHVVVNGPVRAGPTDGAAATTANFRVWRGACDLWWDERLVMRCDREQRECVILDAGPPRSRGDSGAR